MSTAAEYCHDKAAPAGSNTYYALLYETSVLKDQLLPLLALHYEISTCLTASTDPGVNRMKLHWWSEELARLGNGTPRHPTTTLLEPILESLPNNHTSLLKYLHTIESLINGQIVSGLEEWINTLTQGLGQIWLIASQLSPQPEAAAVVQTNGGTIFLVELLQNLHALLHRGYRILPDKLLQTYHLHHEDLLNGHSDQVVTQVFCQLLDRLEQQLDMCYQQLRQYHTPYSTLILNRLTKATCEEIRLDGYLLLKHKLALTPIRKLWIATRTRYYR